MRTITGYSPDGRTLWSDNEFSGPASLGGHGGTEVREPRYFGTVEPRASRSVLTANQRPPTPCPLTHRCRHRPCVIRRVIEAKRLHATTNLTLLQIGQMLGGRDHSTVHYWLHEFRGDGA